MSGSWLKNNFVFNFLHFLKIVLVAVSIYFILSFLSVPRVWTLSLCFLLLAVWYIGLLATTVRAKESGLSIYEYLKHQEEEKLKQAKEAGFETYWEYLAHQRKEEKAQRKAKAAKQKAERKAKREAIAAERKAKQEAKAAERKAKQEAKAAKREAERKAKQEAKAAKQKAERKAKREAKAERKARREAIAAKREAERKAKITKERTKEAEARANQKSSDGSLLKTAAGVAVTAAAVKAVQRPPRVVFNDPSYKVGEIKRAGLLPISGWNVRWYKVDARGKEIKKGLKTIKKPGVFKNKAKISNPCKGYIYWD